MLPCTSLVTEMALWGCVIAALAKQDTIANKLCLQMVVYAWLLCPVYQLDCHGLCINTACLL